MLIIMYIISARELKIAAILFFFLSTYFFELLKKQKTRLKENFETGFIYFYDPKGGAKNGNGRIK